MNISLKKGFTFIPKWEGNKDKKDSEQIKIHFKFISGLDLAELVNMTDERESKIKEWLIVCDKVENLNIDGKEIEPIDIIEQPGLSFLYIEAWTAYRTESEFTEETKKK